MLKVGIIGATGYAGEELIKILLGHPRVTISYLAAEIEKPQPINRIFGHLSGRMEVVCKPLDIAEAKAKAEFFFLALPHRVSLEVAPQLLQDDMPVVDLSADYRFKDRGVYEEWYGVTHTDPGNLQKAVYGLPEWYRSRIRKSKFVANPGCYPTACLLGLLPLVKKGLIKPDSVIIDAKSGLTGAGRKASVDFFFSEINENAKAYKVDCHQHAPEIDQILSYIGKTSYQVVFVPHLLPLNRGILVTMYVQLKKASSIDVLYKLYRDSYCWEPFLRVFKDHAPQLKDVVGTNFCDIGVVKSKKHGLFILVAAIDNLIKGASGQAVQNMNIMCGFKESEGLL
jgi:N-acetyl-gamma-glutamyl-phosphate reductase